jgi:hypothetical protein
MAWYYGAFVSRDGRPALPTAEPYFAQMWHALTKPKLKRTYKVDAPKGVRGRNSDNTLIKTKLGWAPSIPLQVGMEKPIAGSTTRPRRARRGVPTSRRRPRFSHGILRAGIREQPRPVTDLSTRSGVGYSGDTRSCRIERPLEAHHGLLDVRIADRQDLHQSDGANALLKINPVVGIVDSTPRQASG